MHRFADDWHLEMRDVRLRRGAPEVLHGVTVSLRRGECVSVIGPNGAGKTTLLLAMLGLLRPESGRVTLDGRDLHRLSARERGRFASYVPQGLERVPGFLVRDVIEGGRYPWTPPLHPLSVEDRAAIDAAIATCGLAALAERPIHEISAGERQKTLLAAALAQDAQAMFLDEPNTALDPAHQIELAELLHDWLARGRSLLLVSHDLQLPAVLGGRVLAVRDGCIVANDVAERVLAPESLAAIFGAAFETAVTAAGRRIIVPAWQR